MTSTGDAALSISNVSKSYNTTEALRALDLEVGPGRIFGLLGPNGAGKSTLINILVGLLKRDSGTIRVFGETIEYGSYEYKRRVGFVLERPTYVEKLTAREYLELAGSMYDLSDADIDERVSELVAFFDLRDKADDWIETYSRGMRSKVSLAAALIRSSHSRRTLRRHRRPGPAIHQSHLPTDRGPGRYDRNRLPRARHRGAPLRRDRYSSSWTGHLHRKNEHVASRRGRLPSV